jgi:DNA-binding NarL/FixJ family response regulator
MAPNKSDASQQELPLANEELAFQHGEKEKREAELAVANKELVFQNHENVKRAVELVIANEEIVVLTSFKEDRDIKECNHLAVNDYPAKSVEFDAFHNAISDLGLYWPIVNEARQ